ncbi:unnamed protein product [Polarella glacialis]|uniref:Uncharacterized protein n=1 Tax=Polarella glacialis TaxID=89957 RepID=A0A813JY68_POLGL|nr:unnamed protein product [Polarella glacialis]
MACVMDEGRRAMACAMDEAGLLNSMTTEELTVTCERLQRSCKDMEMLLNEFNQEQALLRREQDRIHRHVDKATLAIAEGQKDRGFIGNLLNGIELQLEASNMLSNIFRAKEEQKAAKRRRWPSSAEKKKNSGPKIEAEEQQDDEACGPFSAASIQICNQTLEAHLKDQGMSELAGWVRDTMCGDPVAEAEALPESAELWASSLAASGAFRMQDSTPNRMWNTPSASSVEGLTNRVSFFNDMPSLPASSPRLWAEPAPLVKSKSFGPDGYQVAPEAGEESTFETLVGSALGVVSQHVAQQVAAAQQVAQQAQQVAQQARVAARGGAEGSGSDLPSAPSFSRKLQEAGVVFGWVQDWAAGTAEPSTLRPGGFPPGVELTAFTVVLQRATDGHKWGLAWFKDGFNQNRDRVVESLVPDSLAELWNREQEQAGHPERCIKPFDRLVCANQKSDPNEMTSELAGKRVVLEFQRVTRREQVKVPEDSSHNVSVAVAPSVSHAPSTPSRDNGQGSFQAAFSAYLQKKAPSSFSVDGTEKKPTYAEAEVARKQSEAPPAAQQERQEQHEPPVPVASRVALELASLAADEPAPAVSRISQEEPYAFVAQVLSRGAGSVRLTWLFDWETAATELAAEEWALRGFQVLQSSGDSEEEVCRCDKPPADLQLSVGKRYQFRVRATITDSRGGSGECPLWSSPDSVAVFADLRGAAPFGSSVSSRGPAAASSEPSSSATELQAEATLATASAAGVVKQPSPKATVASKFGSFLAQRPTPGSSPAASPTSPSSGSAGGRIVMGGSASSAAASMSNPLVSAQPRVSMARPHDPAAEKWEMQERLRLRSGQPGNRQSTSTLDLRPRSHSFDSDDEDSLAKISSALSNLERTQAAAKLRESEAIAQEGHHKMLQRLDAGDGSQEAVLRVTQPVTQPSSSADTVENGADLAGSQIQDCRLNVQLADGHAAVLEIRAGEDLARAVTAFVAKHNIRDVCEQPLLDRAMQLSHSGGEDSVDIIDLL